jgi:hypothetical protein
MKQPSPRMLAVAVLFASVTYISSAQTRTKTSQWAHLDHAGKLKYRPLSNGDRIFDFSYAGYMSGGVALPAVPAQRTVRPWGDDDSVAIQTVIDEVSRLPAVKGFRGCRASDSGPLSLRDDIAHRRKRGCASRKRLSG